MIQHLGKLIDCLYFYSQIVMMILQENYFDEYCVPLIEIKYFNALINNKPFFDQPVKSKQEAYEKRIEMSRNDDLYNTEFIRLFVSSKIL